MKRLLILLFHLCFLTANAQMIYNEGEHWGILFPSGKPALPAEYDRIQEVYANYARFYICGKEGNYGLYSLSDSTFTGCRYDSVFLAADKTIHLMLNHKWGFVGYNPENKRSIIVEPAYDQIIMLSVSVSQFDTAWKPINAWLGVSVRLDTLWGVVDFADGKIRIPVKYHHVIDRSDDGQFFSSVDRQNGIKTLIEPFSGVEFKMSWLARVYVRQDWNVIYSIDDNVFDNLIMEVAAWNYATGVEIFRYTSLATDMDCSICSEQIIRIKEELPSVKSQDTRYQWTFINITNGAQLLRFETEFRDEVFVQNFPDKLIVHVYTNGNSSREKLQKTIYR